MIRYTWQMARIYLPSFLRWLPEDNLALRHNLHGFQVQSISSHLFQLVLMHSNGKNEKYGNMHQCINITLHVLLPWFTNHYPITLAMSQNGQYVLEKTTTGLLLIESSTHCFTDLPSRVEAILMPEKYIISILKYHWEDK